MAKGRDVRVTIGLECIDCARDRGGGERRGVSRYTTQKNRRNTPTRLELKKFCCYCNKHTIHREIKK
uniref:Large ribosomal subunit protein bL33c n=1 Tax=Haplomitrium blumei TaxID=258993 RepID=A0A4Y5P7W1_9MARC|nr:ribosomal protein L33 [Haplomitrium blumei]QCW59355.1 ribosomal protein L33 [Haplomitrium blumei]